MKTGQFQPTLQRQIVSLFVLTCSYIQVLQLRCNENDIELKSQYHISLNGNFCEEKYFFRSLVR